MNASLIVYENADKLCEDVANVICPVVGPAKSFNINDVPQDLKYYSNIILIFSSAENDTNQTILNYIKNNKINFKEKKIALLYISVGKHDSKEKLNEIKNVIDKEDIFVLKEDINKVDTKKMLKLAIDIKEYLNTPKFIPPIDVIQKEVKKFLESKNTCTLATGYGDFVRATPLEYEYYEDSIYIISEGGLKFIGLAENKNVCICIYEDYTNMNNLRGLQISGKAKIIKPWTEEYVNVLKRKGLKIENVSKLPFDMNVIKVIPSKYEYLYSKFKNLGFNSKQIYSIKDK